MGREINGETAKGIWARSGWGSGGELALHPCSDVYYFNSL